MSYDFLGNGWAFGEPFASTPEGKVPEARAEESIAQSIWLILSTSRGERVMRPEFGCGLNDLVFGRNDAAMAGTIQQTVREALALWEPRIDVLDVTTTSNARQPNTILIEISYQVRATNSRYNLVYPFYLD
jgi:phage baseplate assembly protein W